MNKFAEIFKLAVLEVHSARTMESDPLQSFKFQVSIPGLPTGVGFQKVSGISRETAVVEYLENMYDHAHKIPGRETVGEVTFTRGMYVDNYLQNIYQQVFTNSAVRNTIVVQVLDRFGAIRREFKFAEAWFSKYEVSDFDATSDDVIIETVTMQFEYFL